MDALNVFAESIAHFGNGTWDLPLLMILGFWTLIAVLLRLTLAILPERNALMHYHLRMGVVYSLPVMIAVAFLIRVIIPTATITIPISENWIPVLVTSAAPVATGMSADTPGPLSQILMQPGFWMGLLLCLMLCGAVIGGIRMAHQIRTLHRLRRNPGMRLLDDDKMVILIRKNLKIPDEVGVYRHPDVAVPMTVGHKNPVIVLPDRHFEPRELKLILHHEWLHIRHGHFVLKVAEEVLRSLFFIHPLVHLLVREITVYREMSCDSEILATSDASGREYASLLLEMAPGPDDIRPPALSASMASVNYLTQRITNMEHYTRLSRKWEQNRNMSMLVAVMLIIPAVLLAACQFDGSTGAERHIETGEPALSADEVLHDKEPAGETGILSEQADPLILIDGEVGDINSLEPSGIKSINVLKGESAIAEFGERGSGGVIQITTK